MNRAVVIHSMDQLPIFKESLQNFKKYPENLVQRFGTRDSLRNICALLQSVALKIFEQEGERSSNLRSLGGLRRPGVQFRNYEGDAALRSRNSSTVEVWCPVDVQTLDSRLHYLRPKYSFLLIFRGNSRSPLPLSLTMMQRIFTEYQVMPSFASMLLDSIDSQEPKAAAFGVSTYISPKSSKGIFWDQLAFGLRGMRMVSDGCWVSESIVALYQCEPATCRMRWIIMGCTYDLDGALQHDEWRDWYDSNEKAEEVTDYTFGVLTLICVWSVEKWSSYVDFIQHSLETKGGNIYPWRPKDAMDDFGEFDITREVDLLQERLMEATMYMEQNRHAMARLRRVAAEMFPQYLPEPCEVNYLDQHITGSLEALLIQIQRCQDLEKNISAKRQRQSHHISTEAAAQGLAVLKLAYLSQNLIRSFGLYLIVFMPCIFVSTLFSTDIVRFTDGKEAFSRIGLARWLEVALPLVVVSLSVFWIWYNLYEVNLWLQSFLAKVRMQLKREAKTRQARNSDVEGPTVEELTHRQEQIAIERY